MDITSSQAAGLWLSSEEGLSRFSPESDSWVSYSKDDYAIDGTIVPIALDATGSVWFGTHDGEVGRFDPRDRSWKSYVPKDFFPKGTKNSVKAASVDGKGGIWFGFAVWDGDRMNGGAGRFDPTTNSWNFFTHEDGLAEGAVNAIAAHSDGALWFGATFGVSRYDGRRFLSSDSRKDKAPPDAFTDVAVGPFANRVVSRVVMDRDGSVWINGLRKGVARFDPRSKSWGVYGSDVSYGLVDDAMTQDRDGALWVAGNSVVSRLVVAGGTRERGALLTLSPQRAKVAVNREWITLTRPTGLTFVSPSRPESLQVQPPLVHAAVTTALAPGPQHSTWVATETTGLLLHRYSPAPQVDAGPVPRHPPDLRLTMAQGMPGLHLTALAPVPGTGNAKVWVATSGGAALVSFNGKALHLDRVPSWDDMPTGPVDAIATMADETVFIAYNKLPADRFLDPKLAARRKRTRVFRVPPHDLPEEIPAEDSLAETDIHSVAYSPKRGLWAGTSSGVYVLRPPGSSDTDAPAEPRFTKETSLSSMPIHSVVIAPDAEHTVWMATDKQGDTPPLVVGFHPGTGVFATLTEKEGIPRGDVIDDMTFTDDGDLVVAVDFQFAKGRVFVPATPTPTPVRQPLWPAPAVFGALLAAAAASIALVIRRNLFIRARATIPFAHPTGVLSSPPPMTSTPSPVAPTPLVLPDALIAQLEPLRARLHAATNTVLPIVGSGLSRGLLSWTALLEQLIAEVRSDADRKELAQALKDGKYLEVAGDLESLVHRARVSAAIERAYKRPSAPRPPTFELLTRLPVTHVATTNYDPWLKDALVERLHTAPQVYVPDDPGAFHDLAPGAPPLVLMLHGDADRPASCVLSEAGYRHLTHFAAYRKALATLFAARSLLFVGHSLTDPDLRSVLDEWQEVFGQGGAPRHFFLGAGLTGLAERRLLDRGVMPMSYGAAGDHALLGPVLEHLATPPGAAMISASTAPARATRERGAT